MPTKTVKPTRNFAANDAHTFITALVINGDLLVRSVAADARWYCCCNVRGMCEIASAIFCIEKEKSLL